MGGPGAPHAFSVPCVKCGGTNPSHCRVAQGARVRGLEAHLGCCARSSEQHMEGQEGTGLPAPLPCQPSLVSQPPFSQPACPIQHGSREMTSPHSSGCSNAACRFSHRASSGGAGRHIRPWEGFTGLPKEGWKPPGRCQIVGTFTRSLETAPYLPCPRPCHLQPQPSGLLQEVKANSQCSLEGRQRGLPPEGRN